VELPELHRLSARLKDGVGTLPDSQLTQRFGESLERASDSAIRIQKSVNTLVDDLEERLRTTWDQFLEAESNGPVTQLSQNISLVREKGGDLKRALEEAQAKNDLRIDPLVRLYHATQSQNELVREHVGGLLSSAQATGKRLKSIQEELDDRLADIRDSAVPDFRELATSHLQGAADTVLETLMETFEGAADELLDSLESELEARFEEFIRAMADEIADEIQTTLTTAVASSTLGTALAPYQPQLVTISAAAPTIKSLLALKL